MPLPTLGTENGIGPGCLSPLYAARIRSAENPKDLIYGAAKPSRGPNGSSERGPSPPDGRQDRSPRWNWKEPPALSAAGCINLRQALRRGSACAEYGQIPLGSGSQVWMGQWARVCLRSKPCMRAPQIHVGYMRTLRKGTIFWHASPRARLSKSLPRRPPLLANLRGSMLHGATARAWDAARQRLLPDGTARRS